jgi:hypothetical protein
MSVGACPPSAYRLRVSSRRALWIAPILISLFFCAPPAGADEGTWEEIRSEDGIRVWRRDVEGSSFVEFRGHGRIESNMQSLLAVLHDQDRKTEWLASCRENRLLRAKKIGQNVIYNRVASDFPLVSDRDVVVETSLHYDEAKRRVQIDVWNTTDPLAPPIDEAVRMPKLKLSWTLTAIDVDTTEVMYQVQADPGGLLPGWVVNAVSKELPFKTISNLRKQVKKGGYEKALAFVEAAFDWDRAYESLGLPRADRAPLP